MKKYVTVLLLLSFLGFTSCKTHQSAKTPPPGQMKKITGTQSAKPFAPGQQKKDRKNP